MPARSIFVSDRNNGSGLPMDEVVRLTIEWTNEVTLQCAAPHGLNGTGYAR